MANIIVSTVGTDGDVIPFVRLGAELSRRGHHATLISHHHYEDLAHNAGLSFAALDDARGSEQLLADGMLSNSPGGFVTLYRKHFLPRVALEYGLIQRLLQPGDTLLVARSTPAIASLCAAEALSVRLVSVFLAPSFISTMPLFEELIGVLLAQEVNSVRAELGLSRIENWKPWLRMPRARVALWPEWFAPAETPGTPVDFAGFALPRPDSSAVPVPLEVETFLNSGDPPVLLTGGTGDFTGAASLAACIHACRQLGFRTIVVTPTSPDTTALASNDVVWIKQVAFERVMQRVRLVIHHGGIGTLAQALAAGTPQLVIGTGADRPDNAAHLKRLGAGEHLPAAQHEPDALTTSLRRLDSPEVRRRCAELARRIALTDGTSRACDLLEEALRARSLLRPEPDLATANCMNSDSRASAGNGNNMAPLLEKLTPSQRARLEQHCARMATQSEIHKAKRS